MGEVGEGGEGGEEEEEGRKEGREGRLGEVGEGEEGRLGRGEVPETLKNTPLKDSVEESRFRSSGWPTNTNACLLLNFNKMVFPKKRED